MIIKNINLGKNNFICLLFILLFQFQIIPTNAEEEIYFGKIVDIKILDKLSSKKEKTPLEKEKIIELEEKINTRRKMFFIK